MTTTDSYTKGFIHGLMENGVSEKEAEAFVKTAQYYGYQKEKSKLEKAAPWLIGAAGILAGTQLGDLYAKKAKEHGWKSGTLSGSAQALAALIQGKSPAEYIR